MLKSRRQMVTTLLRGAWLIIAGVLLLGHTPGLAKPSILIIKKGGVYYISSREQPQAHPAGKHTPALQWLPAFPPARPSIPTVGKPVDLWPKLIQAVSRLDSQRHLPAASAPGVPDLSRLRLGKTHDLPAGNASEPQENIWMAPRYLGRLWGIKTADDLGAPQPGLSPSLPPVPGIQAAIRDVCKNFVTYAQAIPPGADFLVDGNRFSYCFPVAFPYSFRDSWADWRRGGRLHHAVDIFACEGTPVYAITSGVIHSLATGNESGISLYLRGQDGKVYGYMHLLGYVPGIVEGKPVAKGEFIAYVGRTGIKVDAAHLHLQVYADDSFDRNKLVNPYGLLVQLSQGQGVDAPFTPAMARHRIPAAAVVDLEPVTLPGSAPPKPQARQHVVMDASAWLPTNY